MTPFQYEINIAAWFMTISGAVVQFVPKVDVCKKNKLVLVPFRTYFFGTGSMSAIDPSVIIVLPRKLECKGSLSQTITSRFTLLLSVRSENFSLKKGFTFVSITRVCLD